MIAATPIRERLPGDFSEFIRRIHAYLATSA
jgi:hypothetical protein